MSVDLVVALLPFAKEVFKSVVEKAKNISDTKDSLEKLQISTTDIQDKSFDELIQYVFELRSSSLKLFDGLDLFQDELDEALNILYKLNKSVVQISVPDSTEIIRSEDVGAI